MECEYDQIGTRLQPPGHEYRPDDRLVLVLNPVQGPAANAVVRRVEDRDRLHDAVVERRCAREDVVCVNLSAFLDSS